MTNPKDQNAEPGRSKDQQPQHGQQGNNPGQQQGQGGEQRPGQRQQPDRQQQAENRPMTEDDRDRGQGGKSGMDNPAERERNPGQKPAQR